MKDKHLQFWIVGIMTAVFISGGVASYAAAEQPLYRGIDTLEQAVTENFSFEEKASSQPQLSINTSDVMRENAARMRNFRGVEGALTQNRAPSMSTILRASVLHEPTKSNCLNGEVVVIKKGKVEGCAQPPAEKAPTAKGPAVRIIK